MAIKLIDTFCSCCGDPMTLPEHVADLPADARLCEVCVRRLIAVESLREICREIGCSGMSPEGCRERPHLCSIIRKLCAPEEENDN